MPYFKVIGGGSYKDVEGRTFTKDSPPFFAPTDLDQTFLNAFERTEGPPPKITRVEAPQIADEDEENDEEEVVEKVTPPKKTKKTLMGKDISDQYPVAGENGLMVLAVTNGKVVVVEQELPDQPVSPKLLKKNVVNWIESYLSE
jgi:hypothetical protein